MQEPQRTQHPEKSGRNEELTLAIVHQAVFLFVTALTTTGFGDITLQGTTGRLISVVIMIFGVTLFLRLLRTLLQPHKVRFGCPTCGLQRHDADAVRCKACGTVLNIPDEGTIV